MWNKPLHPGKKTAIISFSALALGYEKEKSPLKNGEHQEERNHG
jgi:hypothetical protein